MQCKRCNQIIKEFKTYEDGELNIYKKALAKNMCISCFNNWEHIENTYFRNGKLKGKK